jgi:hypothetical protein
MRGGPGKEAAGERQGSGMLSKNAGTEPSMHGEQCLHRLGFGTPWLTEQIDGKEHIACLPAAATAERLGITRSSSADKQVGGQEGERVGQMEGEWAPTHPLIRPCSRPATHRPL